MKNGTCRYQNVSELTLDGLGDKAGKILQGAMQEFLTHGYAATSMDRVAAAAGVSKATVYSHFQSKEGLFNELVQQIARLQYEDYFDQPMHGDPAEVLREFITLGINRMMGSELYVTFNRLLLGESGRFPELAKVFLTTIAKPPTDRLTAYLIEHPELHLADPEATARVIVGTMVYQMMNQEIMFGKDVMPIDNDRIIESLLTLVLNHAPQPLVS